MENFWSTPARYKIQSYEIGSKTSIEEPDLAVCIIFGLLYDTDWSGFSPRFSIQRLLPCFIYLTNLKQ